MTAIQYLSQETGTPPGEWEETDGPDSGFRVDLHLVHPSLGIWYVTEDQGTFAAECCDD